MSDTSTEIELARFLPIMDMSIAIQRRQVIAQAVKELMVEDQDYGYINPPGKRREGEKAFLLQPGAQKLDNLFGLVPRFIVEDKDEDWTGARHGNEPFFRYLVKCQLWRGDVIMGEAIGECNSFESKYRWRAGGRRCLDCDAMAIIETKHKAGKDEGKPKGFWCAPFKGGCGSGFKLDDERITSQINIGRVPNPDICDQVNTFIKMAQKRAHVGATINSTSASELFSQDPDAVGADLEEGAPTGPVAAKRVKEEEQKQAENDSPVLQAFLATFRGIAEDEYLVSDIYAEVKQAHGDKAATKLWQMFGDPTKDAKLYAKIARQMWLTLNPKAEAK